MKQALVFLNPLSKFEINRMNIICRKQVTKLIRGSTRPTTSTVIQNKVFSQTIILFRWKNKIYVWNRIDNLLEFSKSAKWVRILFWLRFLICCVRIIQDLKFWTLKVRFMQFSLVRPNDRTLGGLLSVLLCINSHKYIFARCPYRYKISKLDMI